MEDEVATRNPAAKFLCTPIGSMKKSFVKQKTSRKHAANTSLVYKQSLTSNNRQLARTLEKTKEELADALSTNLSLAHENSVLASKVLAFRRMAELKNEEVEREVQSRVQQRLHCISDMLSDVVRSRAVTTDLLAAAADACRGFTVKTLENLFDESIQYCSKLPSRIPTGGQKWNPRVTACREQMDTPSDDLHDDENVGSDNKAGTRTVANLIGVATPTATEHVLPAVSPDAEADLSANQTIVASSEEPQSPHGKSPAADCTVPVAYKPAMCHDEIPVGPRLSGSFCRAEATQKAEVSDGLAPSGGLYEVVLSPPKIFKKYIDGAGLGTSSVSSCGARRNQPVVRRTTATTSMTKCATSGAPASTTIDSRGRRRSTFCLRTSQGTAVDDLLESVPLIADESDSILIVSPHDDSSPSDRPLPVKREENIPDGIGSSSAAVAVTDESCPEASDTDFADSGEAVSSVASSVGSKTVTAASDTRQAVSSLGLGKAVSQLAAPTRQMDIVMAKPGELHFFVGSRDGTRQPNHAEVRPTGSCRSKKRQTFVASSIKLPDGQLEEKTANLCGPSVFDYKGTPVACANKTAKDAMDTYELSLSESIVSELPRPQYRSEAAISTATAKMPSNESHSHKTTSKERHKKTAEVDSCLPHPTERLESPSTVASSKSAEPPTQVNPKQKKKSQSKHHPTELTKENNGICHAVSPSSKVVASKKLPLAPCQVTPSKHVASAHALASPTSCHTATPARRDQNDSYNVFTDSIIERYTQECHKSEAVPPTENLQRSATKRTPSKRVLLCDPLAAESTSEGVFDGDGREEHENPRRRRCTTQINYAEPPLGKKLRRGDPGTSNIYSSDGNATTDCQKRSSVKRTRGSKGPSAIRRVEPLQPPSPQ